MKKNRDYQFGLGAHITRFETITSEHGSYITGCVFTFHGAVWVYSQGDEKSFHHTALQFPKGNTVFVRNIPKRFTKRGLVTQAKKFAAEVTAKVGK